MEGTERLSGACEVGIEEGGTVEGELEEGLGDAVSQLLSDGGALGEV